jgi:NitT/TauT family transport system substrate-binding protein
MRAMHTLALLILALASLGSAASAADKVRMSIFQSNFCCFPPYVAQELKLFQKHGIEVEFVYGTGIQVANILVSGAAEFGSFATEHALVVSSKGQDVKLLVATRTLAPFSLIVRNEVPTPNAGKPYPEMLKDLKGLKIGISTPGASTDVALQYLLREGGLDPKRDVTIVPVGDPSTALAALKNGLIDANLAVQPTQTAAIAGLKIAKAVVDIESGEGPAIFRDYAYNSVFARASYLKEHGPTARAVVEAVVEAEQIISDPSRMDDVMRVAVATMRGIDPALLRAYIDKFRPIFTPVATRKGIENVNQLLLAGNLIAQAVPYDQIVAQDFMPKEFPSPAH